jgi:putative DNA primase/helicase
MPTHKLVLATNNKPELEIDDAARRRVHLVPFKVSFRGREDRNISEKLKAEAPGILHLMIQACLEWQRMGLSPPQSVTDATTGLFRDLDPLGRFMDECLDKDASAFSYTAELVKAYLDFLHSNGEDQYVEQKTLITQIRERGDYQSGKKRNATGQELRGLRGVAIKDPQKT